MKYTSFYLIKRLFNEYTKPRLPLLLLAIFFMIVFAAANSSQIIIVKEVFDKVFHAQDPYYARLMPLVILGVYLIYGLSNYAANVTMGFIGLDIVNSMQKRLFNHMVDSDMEFHYGKSAGELVSRIQYDTNFVRAAVTDLMVNVFKQGFTMLGVISLMFYQNWELSLVAFSILIFVVFPIAIMARKLRKLARQGQEQVARLTNLMTETLTGIRTVKAYQGEDFESERIGRSMDKTFRNRFRSLRVSNFNGPMMAMFSGFALAAVIWYIGVTPDKSKQSEIMAFAVGLIMLLRPAKSMGSLSNTLQNALAAAERYFTMIDWNPTVVEKADSKDIKVNKGEIRLENVSFDYNDETGSTTRALKSVNILVPAGKKVALVGPSGSGKSTVINAILRFFDCSEGKVLIDGQDISEVKIDSLRRAVSLVTQEVFLFDDTIKANIAYGLKDISEESVIKSAQIAAADEFIRKLPQGYETMVGENGIRLSGGQKQRISIARAVMRNTPILLLDEATSSLDTIAEAEFHEALDKLIEGRTTLIIAHRLSTVINCDIIYLINNGVIEASGTHDELLKNSETYKNLFNL